jgi:hypothetical protein
MRGPSATPSPRLRRFALPSAAWIGLAAIGWGGVGWLGLSLLGADPPRAGFDLGLVLEAGRAVAGGRSPYDPAIIDGSAPAAVRLFYSYPPPIAQVASLLAPLPLGAVLAGLGVLAVGGLAVVTGALRRYFAPWLATLAAVGPVVGAGAVVLPFAIAILFGNLDALFPFVYGAALLGALNAGRWPMIAGAAIAAASVGKIYPAGLGLWFLVREARARIASGQSTPQRHGTVLGVAVGTGALVVLASVLAGGVQTWVDYATVARVVAGAELVDPRNFGPAAQVAMWLGGGEGLARTLHVGVLVLAIGAIAWAAWWIDDPVHSLTVAATASLVLLPITWYHYAAALIPFAVAAVMRERSPRTLGLVAAAGGLAAVGIVSAPVLWLAAGSVVAATRPARADAERNHEVGGAAP